MRELYIGDNGAFTEPNTWGTMEVSHSFQSFETGGGFEFFLGF